VLVVIVLIGRERMQRWVMFVPRLVARKFGRAKAVSSVVEGEAP
jgi:branched-chain amino acid transport system permease protein